MEIKKVENFDKYIKELNDDFSTNISWKELQHKSEFGYDKSEKWFQDTMSIEAKLIAYKLGYNEYKAELFTKILSSYFPICGNEGKKCIKEYLKEHGKEMSDARLATNFIFNDFENCECVIAEGLEDYLLELFDENIESQTPEIEIAKLCHEMGNLLKTTFKSFNEPGYYENYKKVSDQLDRDAVNNIKKYGLTGFKNKIKEEVEKRSKNNPKMTDLHKKRYKKIIDGWVEEFGLETGVYNFIAVEVVPCNEWTL